MIFLDETLIIFANTTFLDPEQRSCIIVASLPLAVYDIFFFQPLSDTFGWFVTVIQRLTLDMIKFMYFLTSILLCISVTTYFFSWISSTNPYYKTFFSALCDALLIVVGHSELPSFGSKFHLANLSIKLFLVTINLLILNFLIAIFSDSVGNIMRNFLAISTVQKICILSRMERFFRKWPLMEKFYDHQRHKYFDVIDGRVLLKVKDDQ